MPRINPGLGPIQAAGAARKSSNQLKASLEKLASGLKINKASDNPAGLIISEMLRSEIGGLRKMIDGAARAAGMLDTADAAMGQIGEMLGRAKAEVLAAADSTLPAAARAALQQQVDNTLDSVNRITNSTTFGSMQLLTGEATVTTGQGSASIDLESTSTSYLGTGGDPTVESLETLRSGGAGSLMNNPAAAAETLDRAIMDLNVGRGRIGSFVRNHIEPQINAWQVELENVTAGESAIRDTDYAVEVSNLVRSQLLHQSTISTIGRSNESRTNVLSLLR